MTMPPTKLLVAWAFGTLLVSGAASGQAAPGPAPVTTSPKGQVTQKPTMRPATGLLAAPASVSATTSSPSSAAEPATAEAAADAAAPAISVSEARGALERGMTELGELAARARQSGDAMRIACVQDKQDRAGAVMEVATSDLLVAQDAATDAQTRAFAGEKLGESAQQMRTLVGQARACQGREEANESKSSNDVRVPQSVAPQDPTSPGAPASRGLPPIDPRPPVASPVL